MSALRQLRLAARALLRAPGYSIVSIATIALGIGATTAVFSVVDGVLFKPLGYREPERLVYLASTRGSPDQLAPPSYPDFVDWRASTRSFSAVAFARGETFMLRASEGTERLTAAVVSDGFFRLFGARPLIGRTFTPDEEQPGAPRVAVMAYGYWQSRFAGDSSVIGRTLATSDGALTVIGVMPPSFVYPFEWAQVWTPIAPMVGHTPTLEKRDLRVDNRVVARLAPDVTVAQARSELDALSRRLASLYPKEDAGWSVNVVPLREVVVQGIRPALLVLLGAVGLVLLIACANVANLTLARATARAREISLRAALGAGRRRIVGALLSESIVLAAAGTAFGVALAVGAVRALRAAAAGYLPRVGEIGVDPRALAVSALLALATTLLVGLAPALHATGGSLLSGLKEGTSGGGRGRRGARMRSALVAAELALSVVLLVGAALLGRSFLRLLTLDTGIEPEHLVTISARPEESRVTSADAALALYARLRDAVATIPGVRSVGLISHAPLSQAGVVTPIEVPGREFKPGENDAAVFRLVDASYFGTVGQRVVAGRGFGEGDMRAASDAIIVNETTAKRLWPGKSAIGQHLVAYKQLSARADYNQRIDATVVGVVGDVREFGPEVPPDLTVYLPMPVNPWRAVSIEVRAAGDPSTVAAAARARLRALDPTIPFELTTATAMLDSSLAPRRFQMLLIGTFAASALLLACVGVYGILAYVVAQRTREMGVRAALGATPGALRRQIVSDGARLIALGLAVGVVAAWALARTLASLLFEVSPRDPLTFATVPAVLALVALAATWIPAMRASRVDPIIALRSE
jgi:putative ABC transport system permease protein